MICSEYNLQNFSVLTSIFYCLNQSCRIHRWICSFFGLVSAAKIAVLTAKVTIVESSVTDWSVCSISTFLQYCPEALLILWTRRWTLCYQF